MLSIYEINLLQSQNERLKKQNEELQNEVKKLKMNYQRIFEIEKKKPEERTEEEEKFLKYIYHMEELQAGLDVE